MFEPLQQLPRSHLAALAESLQHGPLANGMSARAIEQIIGPAMARQIVSLIEELGTSGWTPQQIGLLASAMLEERNAAPEPDKLLDLVLSGPDLHGEPTRDTMAVVHSLFEECQDEVLLVAYAVYNGDRLFLPLAQRMQERPQIKATFCLNVERRQGDTSLASEITKRFGKEFVQRHWPWMPRPALFYDPRALDTERGGRCSLHAKCLVIDRRVALVTSANFTEAAQKRNIEAGVVIRHQPFVERIAYYFDALLEKDLLRPIVLTD